MEINFDNLKKIDTILEKIEILEQKINSEKRLDKNKLPAIVHSNNIYKFIQKE